VTRRLWVDGYRYAKAGEILDALIKPESAPKALIDAPLSRRDALMRALDDVNGRFGRGALFPASAGVRRA
jgi:DNA polymerase V